MSYVNLLETTLRDGSYAIDFSFTAADTAALCRALEAVGVRYIEVGHGSGLGASRRGLGTASASDSEYLEAARDALQDSVFGAICIPGVATLADLRAAADRGMGFVRVATDARQVEESEPFLALAKRRGMMATANHMKSYAVTPSELADNARRSEAYGADVVYIVDSAGCMVPDQVAGYVHACKEAIGLPVGFHGHDNLGLAVANSVRAVQEGAAFVDSSLDGLGRSGGNANTERLIAALHRSGIRTSIDFLRAVHITPRFVDPHWRTRESGPLDVVAGFAGFHSKFLPAVVDAARRRSVDAGRLIIELCKVSKVEVREEVLERIADRLATIAPAVLDEMARPAAASATTPGLAATRRHR